MMDPTPDRQHRTASDAAGPATASLAAPPEPYDGDEYAEAAERAVGAWRAGLTAGDGIARFVATVEATRRIVDGLRAEREATMAFARSETERANDAENVVAAVCALADELCAAKTSQATAVEAWRAAGAPNALHATSRVRIAAHTRLLEAREAWAQAASRFRSRRYDTNDTIEGN